MPATCLTPHVVTSRAKQVSHARLASVQRFWVAATVIRRRITTASANRQAARLAGPLAVMFNSRGEDPAEEKCICTTRSWSAHAALAHPRPCCLRARATGCCWTVRPSRATSCPRTTSTSRALLASARQEHCSQVVRERRAWSRLDWSAARVLPELACAERGNRARASLPSGGLP